MIEAVQISFQTEHFSFLKIDTRNIKMEVILGELGLVGIYFGRVGVGGDLFWVSGGERGSVGIFCGWVVVGADFKTGWVLAGIFFGSVGMCGVQWG